MELRICVPFNSRSTAWASFDGRGRVELRQGDHIKVTASRYPFPTVCADKQSTDWFHAIGRTLKWNERQRQKSFVVVEEPNGSNGHGPTPHTLTSSSTAAAPKSRLVNSLTEGSSGSTSEEEEDESFDIDDLSSDATTGSTSSPSRTRTFGSIFSLMDSPDRFRDPLPHPPKTSRRHGSGYAGDRDDLREPLEAKVLKATAPINSPEVVAPLSRHHPVKDDNLLLTSFEAMPLKLPSPDGQEGLRRAFAVVGEDYSDSASETES